MMIILLITGNSCSRRINYIILQVKDKRAELEKKKNAFVRRASEFLRNYFSSLVDFMISDNGYFSQVWMLVYHPVVTTIKAGSFFFSC